MKGCSSPGNIENPESVKINQEDIDYAARLQDDPEMIRLLVEIIFAGGQDRLPPS